MPLKELIVPLGIGLSVWFGAYFPFRRMLSSVVDGRASFLALGLSSTLGVAALTAWRQEPAYRFTVLAICLSFIGMYVVVVSREKIAQASV